MVKVTKANSEKKKEKHLGTFFKRVRSWAVIRFLLFLD